MKRIYFIAIFALLAAIMIVVKIIMIINNDVVSVVSSSNGTYTIKAIDKYANIYDCNMNLLVNLSDKYRAVIIPNHISSIQLQPYLIDKETYYIGIKGRKPFLCEVNKDALYSGIDAIFFKSAKRNDVNQLAPHIIGYTSCNEGVYGIEKAYNDFFRENYTINTVTFKVDARGEVLNGLEQETLYSQNSEVGIITTLDKNIQEICENVFDEKGINCGSVVVMDIKNCEIKASVSYPDFDITNLSEYIDDLSSPFINRAFSAYSVGSIFKLVTAAAALEQGISSEFSYNCTGAIDVNGQIFNCHKWGGHGEINMNEAVVQSCNTYFIALSEYLDKEKYINLAKKLGFGQENVLCDGIVSVTGNLQSVSDIAIAAERANMSFGQGKLTATPLQICRMTAAIANNGKINQPSLIKGFVNNENKVIYNTISYGEQVLAYETAVKLKAFMRNVVCADNSMSVPNYTTAAGKTSTAQTGWYTDNGNEIYNCWFTGFFPSYNPEYAVTVLIEGGISGNRDAGPVFKDIADDIIVYKNSLRNN